MPDPISSIFLLGHIIFSLKVPFDTITSVFSSADSIASLMVENQPIDSTVMLLDETVKDD